MLVEYFIELYDPCEESIAWWETTSYTTMKEVWECKDLDPKWRMWVATRNGVLDDITLRLFACFCARQVIHIANDVRYNQAVDIAERHANGKATDHDLSIARESVMDTNGDVFDSGRIDAVYATLRVRAIDAAVSASSNAIDAIEYAINAEYANNAMAKQSEWLIQNATPSFCK